ncbi:cytochrome c family protein [Pseudoalteromonas fuliginea]|uniref:cytochrome c family protein n=1 Tax=Pseudoalteromonas fuliginea TaxID=1872678 RepID=UPI0021D10C27|nr:cytochrome c family protein [Pseudoalteromonas fuliginea]
MDRVQNDKYNKEPLCYSFLCSCFSAIANDECQSCHQKQTSDWKQSDHASSMALANKDTVLGDFNNVTTTHFSQKAEFYKENDAFLVDLTEQSTKKRTP